MNSRLQNNGVIIFDEIEPDPKAAENLKALFAQFAATVTSDATSNAMTGTSNGGLLLATANNITPDLGIDDALLKRFTPIVFAPPDAATVKKVAQRETDKLLDKKKLSALQRTAAAAFIMGKAPSLHDPNEGFRGMAQSIKDLMAGSDFADLIEEHSPAGTKRGFEKAFKGGAKKAGAAPATARFKRGRTP